MIHLFLDDSRPCPKGFVHAKDANECILLLRECDVCVLSLDYNLGWNAPTGLDVARFIVTSGRYPERIYMHSSSAAGRRRMLETLYPNKPDHVRIYNHPVPDDLLLLIASGKFGMEK
jgi:hypothetical protein